MRSMKRLIKLSLREGKSNWSRVISVDTGCNPSLHFSGIFPRRLVHEASYTDVVDMDDSVKQGQT